MKTNLKIIVASDHVGYEMKKELQQYMTELGHDVTDIGCHSTDRAEYPIFGRMAAEQLATGEFDRAVLVCGTGFGIALAANTVKGVRCVNCTDMFTAKLSRQHNNSNAIALGARVLAPEYAKMLLETWLTTDFDGGRHADRMNMISEMENLPNE